MARIINGKNKLTVYNEQKVIFSKVPSDKPEINQVVFITCDNRIILSLSHIEAKAVSAFLREGIEE